MLKIIYLPNRFSPEGKIEREFDFVVGKHMLEYIKSDEAFPKDIDLKKFNVINAGKVEDRFDFILRNEDQIIITPIIEDPATLYAAFTAALAFAVAHPIFFAFYVLAVGYSVYSAITAKQRMPNFGNSGLGMDDGSPTYGWDGMSQTRDVGIPVAIIYGEHRVGGNVINEYVWTDGDKNYLNQLIALCEGEISGISSIKVNKNPIENFDGVALTTKVGTNSQSVIPNFEDLHNLYDVTNQLLQSNPYVYTTIDSDVEGFEIHLLLPSGLYQTDSSNGQINAWSVTYQVEYKLHASGTYIDLGTTTIDTKSRSAVRRVFRKDGLTAGQYDIRVTRTSVDSDFTHQGDLYFQQLDEIKTDDLKYPNTALLGIELLATEQLSGQSPNITSLVKGKLIRIPDVRYLGSPIAWDLYYWDPGAVTFKRLSDSAACTWDGVTYITGWSANPIWCLRDLITNTRYGLGEFIDVAQINDTVLLEMAKYADERVPDGAASYEKRFRLDCVIDTYNRALDLIMQISATFAGFPYYSAGAVQIKIDKPTSPTQVFGMGNIVAGSFRQAWKSIKELPNVIEVTFNDAQKDYEQETIAVIDEDSLTAGDPMRKQPLRIFCSRASQAIRIGRYALKVAKYIDRSIVFRASIDAIACTIGDIIDISHDVPQWGFSGRIKSGSTVSIVKLDQTVVVAPATSYKVEIRFADGTVALRDVTNSPGSYTDLNITPALSSAPAALDVYAFGVSSIQTKPFRIVSMSKTIEDEVEITAIEYEAAVYDDSDVTLPTNNYSALSTTIPIVTNLDTTERAVVLPDGSTISVIDVYFDKPDDSALLFKYKEAKIYISDNGGSSYTFVGKTEGVKFTISDNITAGTYHVKAVTVMASGMEDSLSHAPTDSLTVIGSSSVPDIVSNFSYSWGDILRLVWTPNIEADLNGYEIRDNNTNWGVEDANLIWRGNASEYLFNPGVRSGITYYIRAFNKAGVYSTTSASITPANTAPSAPTNLGADIFFNVARLYWDDVAGVDLLYYEIYSSETNAWAGEEVKVGTSPSKSLMVEGAKSRNGTVESLTTTTVVDSSLIGFPDDYFIGDKILFTNGSNVNEEREITDFLGATGEVTVAATWTVNPTAGDRFIIFDQKFYKVRGVDNYGVGTFSSAFAVKFENIDENSIGDNIITARKIYVACLSALSANLGCVTAGVLQGPVFQTAAGNARTMFDSGGIRSYDSSCNLMFQVCDGNILAKSVKFQDPLCDCCYSCLGSGQWYFHDQLGNTIPYVKRIKSGTVASGAYVCLCGWCSSPDVLVGIKSLDSYNKDYSGQTQHWDVYTDAPIFYCNSSTDYGYCFQVHASLNLAASTTAHQVVNISLGTAGTCTCVSTCAACVRSIFQLWCNAACANYYYGSLCYRICYRVAGCGVWCACDYTFNQPHGSVGQMQTNTDAYVNIGFPCNATWEIMPICNVLNWVDSGINSAGVLCCLCTRAMTACAVNRAYGIDCCCSGTGYNRLCCAYYSDAITVAGSKPANTYCTFVCYALNDHSQCMYNCLFHKAFSGAGHNCVGVSFFNGSGTSLYSSTKCVGALCCTSDVTVGPCNTDWSQACGCHDYTGCADAAFNSFSICSCLRSCFSQCNIGTMCYRHCVCSQVDLVSGNVYHCHCVLTGSAGSCSLQIFYSHADTLGTQTILDPAGILNYIAVGYS